MEYAWLALGIAATVVVIFAAIRFFAKKPNNEDGAVDESADTETEEYEGEEDGDEDADADDEPQTEPEIKRGVLVEKDCFVDKDGTFVPDGAERSRVCFFVRIRTTDGAEEEYVVDERDYTSVEKGDAVTYMKQGTKFLGFGVDVDEETEE